jgi:hypothetical protein
VRAVTFKTDIFKTPRDVERGQLALDCFLRTLFAIDFAYLQDYPTTPKLYHTHVRYRVEPKRPLVTVMGEQFFGLESWKSVPIVLADGFGDCEDLACWRAAELNMEGIKARPFWKVRVFPGKRLRLYHIMVRYPDGRVEDPSKRLGMPG